MPAALVMFSLKCSCLNHEHFTQKITQINSWGEGEGGGGLHLALATCMPVQILCLVLHPQAFTTKRFIHCKTWPCDQFFSSGNWINFMLFCDIFLRVTKSKNLGAGPKVFSWKLSPALTILLFVFQGVMLVYDITREKTLDNISNWLTLIEEVIMTENNLTSKERCITALW